MAKIYNEIVIDMNPESSTFEETIYEDSYEYEGDMMLAQESLFDVMTGSVKKWTAKDIAEKTSRERKKEGLLGGLMAGIGKIGMALAKPLKGLFGFLGSIGKIFKSVGGFLMNVSIEFLVSESVFGIVNEALSLVNTGVSLPYLSLYTTPN